MKRNLSQRILVAATVFLGIMSVGHIAFGFEDARVLPVGIGRFSFVYAQTSGVNEQFDSSGNRESITQPYNVDLSAKALKAVDPGNLGKLIDGLNASGFKYNAKNANSGYSGLSAGGTGTAAGDAVDLGQLVPDANIVETQYNIGFQYGLTDRLTVGFNVPIVNVNTTLNASLNGPNTAQAMAAAFSQPGIASGSSPVGAALQKLGGVNVAQIRQLVEAEAGYNVPQYSTQSGLGDVVFGGRYNYYHSYYQDVISSLQAGVIIPTGAMHDPANPTQIDLGNGAWGVGAAHIFNYSPTSFLTLSNGLHYTHFLPSSANKIPQSLTDPSLLPPVSNEQNVSMQLGDRYEANLGASLHVTQALGLNASYDWWWKKADFYNGSNPDSDYFNIGYQTNEYLETLQAGISVSSIEAFKKKDFFLPCDVAFNVYIPRAGRNAPIGPYGTLEMALYL